MSVTFFKRYRMEIDLRGRRFDRIRLPSGYRLVAWDPSLCEDHARTKFECFDGEVDASLFPCLGEPDGCSRLMEEISSKDGFLPQATWLVEHVATPEDRREFCGTIQGVQVNSRYGSIQNVGVTPLHRGHGLATQLLTMALSGFQHAGLRRVFLEATVQNDAAIRLYRHVGFRQTKTLYKSVEVVWT